MLQLHYTFSLIQTVNMGDNVHAGLHMVSFYIVLGEESNLRSEDDSPPADTGVCVHPDSKLREMVRTR